MEIVKKKTNIKILKKVFVVIFGTILLTLSAKIKIADITQHSIVSNEIITHKENNKGITKTYDLTADSKLEEVSIAGYKIVHKKVLKEKNGWRTLVLIEYKIS